jgi:hypothetical protein
MHALDQAHASIHILIFSTVNTQLRVVNPAVGFMTSLRKLNLDLNELTCLPPELSYCTNLKDLKLEGNAIKSPPREVRPTLCISFCPNKVACRVSATRSQHYLSGTAQEVAAHGSKRLYRAVAKAVYRDFFTGSCGRRATHPQLYDSPPGREREARLRLFTTQAPPCPL